MGEGARGVRKAKPQVCSHTDLSGRETCVVYGVSRRGRGFGFLVAKQLEKRGFTFGIVHPEAEHIGGWIPARHVKELTSLPDVAILCSPPARSGEILTELAEAGLRRVYASWGSMDQNGRDVARERGLEICEDCPLLHIDGLGFPHNLHRRWVRWRSLSSCRMEHAGRVGGSP